MKRETFLIVVSESDLKLYILAQLEKAEKETATLKAKCLEPGKTVEGT